MPADIEAFVLIGGRSSRFGSDKAVYEFEGEALMDRAARIVQAARLSTGVRFVAASETQFGAEINRSGRDIVYDRRPGLGGWSGLDAALFNSTAEWTLVLACDLPFMTAVVLETLWSAASDRADAVMPRQRGGKLQPLCAMYRTARVGPVVDNVTAAGERLPPLSSIVDLVETAFIDTGKQELRNVNSPSDLL